MAQPRITREHLEASFADSQSLIQGKANDKKQTLMTAAAVGGIILLLIFFLLGKRAGKKKTTFLEIRRV